MTLLYEHHYETDVAETPSIDPDSLAEIIYDSVRKDYAITVSWQDEGIRREWGIVTEIDHTNQRIKLLRDDGGWWIPVNQLLQVERV
ncbi:YolD-like family protein [Brevibacillus reuszeri]|uniref:YolD-like family protein n=1 Tax=Brevibacillus reuszeri TaxID=54915 RepID=UPI000CCC6FF8|nr:YolD-like family protein [Brevibacillus reuszeri]